MSREEPTFVYRSGMSADEIPARKLTAEELGLPPDRAREGRYVNVPLDAVETLPPEARIVLAVHYAKALRGEDERGGWIHFRRNLYAQFDLLDRSVRRRAVEAAVRSGSIEVRRHRGKVFWVRLPKKEGKK